MPIRNGTADYTHNRLMSTDTAMYGYDSEGQLSSKQEGATTSYTFDKAYRLTGIGANTQFSYDGAGNRIRAVRSGTETRYIYDASGNLLAEADGNNTITRYYVHGVGLLAAITPSDDLYCYHFDATGNTVAVTDGSENVVNSYDYSPFGMILSETETFTQPFKYVGKLGVMSEGDFYYMRARYYDPLVGRFISEDPKGFDGGDVNLYVYAGNNPVLLVDPWGLESGWATYGPNGVITGEVGIQPVVPVPNVRIGVDSPVGGVTTTLPFHSGGEPTTVQTSPSFNIPVVPGVVNIKMNGAVNPSRAIISVRSTVSSPVLGARGSINSRGEINANLLGPQLNFPLGFGVNAFIGTSW